MADGLVHAVVLLVGLAALRPRLASTNAWARLGALAVVELYTLRYWAWRALHTLPPLALSPASLYQWGFFGIESLSMVFLCWTALLLVRHADYAELADEREHSLRNRPHPPSVCVFIPTANECRELLERTIRAAMLSHSWVSSAVRLIPSNISASGLRRGFPTAPANST